jgi:hypothetical protein
VSFADAITEAQSMSDLLSLEMLILAAVVLGFLLASTLALRRLLARSR